MENENRAPKLVQLTVKVNQTTLDKWKENLQEGMYPTAGQFMETLINQYEENYSHPIRVNRDNEQMIKELNDRIAVLVSENDALTAKIGNAEKQLNELKERAAGMESELETTKKHLLCSDAELNERNEADNGVIRVPVDELDRACLQYLSDRENRKRNRNDITPEIFFMYAVKEMLIKGNKFSIPCVPDSVIRQLKNQIENAQEETTQD